MGKGTRQLEFFACLLLLAAAACKKPSDTQADGQKLPPGASGVAPLAATAPPPPPTAPPPTTVLVDPRAGMPSFAPIAKQADRGVVTITTLGEDEEPTGFRRRGARERRGLGTGFVIEKDGLILSNNHVIEGADVIRVKLSDDREFDAKIIGRDPQTDIAVLRIEAKELTTLPLGDSETLDVGDWVVAIGNPFGLSHTVSVGILSARGRTQEDVPLDPAGYYDFLQTDASINPGNSGGPLLNLKGEVVGINTAIRGNGAQGIGFAIPINMVKKLLPMLVHDGHITRSALGVTIHDLKELSPEDRAQLKIVDANGQSIIQSGAVIEAVEPGGPAERAGLQPGDIILKFERDAVERRSQLQWLASTFGVGNTATLRVARSGTAFDIKVTLGDFRARPRPRANRGLPPGFPP